MPDRAERRRLGRVLCGLMRPLRGAPSESVSGKHCATPSAGELGKSIISFREEYVKFDRTAGKPVKQEIHKRNRR